MIQLLLALILHTPPLVASSEASEVSELSMIATSELWVPWTNGCHAYLVLAADGTLTITKCGLAEGAVKRIVIESDDPNVVPIEWEEPR